MGLALRYAAFAALAIAANVAAQHLTGLAYAGAGELWLALAVGTGVGLAVKYLLDKRWIFAYRVRDLGHDLRTFAAYAATGVFTTAVFWGAEFAFDLAFGTRAMRYLGGVLGLAFGYWLKYRLDKRWVFAGARA